MPYFTADPIGVEGEFFDLELRPAEWRTWGEVEGEHDLDIRLVGAY